MDLIIPQRLRARHWKGFRCVMITGERHYGAGNLLSLVGHPQGRTTHLSGVHGCVAQG